MRVIDGLENIDEQFENLCVALGTFDGVHLGHRKVIEGAVKKAKEINGISMVFTFSPHPLKVIKSSHGPKLINSREEKIYLMESMGVDILLLANFTVEFAEIHPETFISRVLKDTLNVKELFVGFNYTFGKHGAGNTDYLLEMSHKYGFQLEVFEPVKVDENVVSSTLIRKAINKGNLAAAEELLGNPYMITGRVISGKRLATELGFPTANLKLVNKIYPPYGVYGVKVFFAENEEIEYNGVMNIGINPTLKPGEHSIEVHLFDFRGNIYGKTIIIKVLEFIREEKKFDSIDDLRKTIENDIKKWRERIRCL